MLVYLLPLSYMLHDLNRNHLGISNCFTFYMFNLLLFMIYHDGFHFTICPNNLCSNLVTMFHKCPPGALKIPEDSVTFDHQGFSCRRSLGLSVEEFGILSNTQLSPAEIEMVYGIPRCLSDVSMVSLFWYKIKKT